MNFHNFAASNQQESEKNPQRLALSRPLHHHQLRGARHRLGKQRNFAAACCSFAVEKYFRCEGWQRAKAEILFTLTSGETFFCAPLTPLIFDFFAASSANIARVEYSSGVRLCLRPNKNINFSRAGLLTAGGWGCCRSEKPCAVYVVHVYLFRAARHNSMSQH